MLNVLLLQMTSTHFGFKENTVIMHLQRVKNAAAHLVCDLRPHDHVTPALKQLHWLPIKSRIVYKLFFLMHNIHTGRAPQYLVDCVSPSASSSSLRLGLRSSHTAKYVKHTMQTKLGERAFSYAGPAAWNALPASLHDITDTSKF